MMKVNVVYHLWSACVILISLFFENRYAVHSLLAPSTYTERLTRIRVIESFGGRPYVQSCANITANMRVTSKQIRYDGYHI